MARFGLSMPVDPYNNFLFDHSDWFLKFLGSNFELASPFF